MGRLKADGMYCPNQGLFLNKLTRMLRRMLFSCNCFDSYNEHHDALVSYHIERLNCTNEQHLQRLIGFKTKLKNSENRGNLRRNLWRIPATFFIRILQNAAIVLEIEILKALWSLKI